MLYWRLCTTFECQDVTEHIVDGLLVFVEVGRLGTLLLQTTDWGKNWRDLLSCEVESIFVNS